MSEELAVIDGADVGARDVGRPVLWFSVKALSGGALQVFGLNDPIAVKLLSSVHSVADLNGKACVVEHSNGMIRFLRLQS